MKRVVYRLTESDLHRIIKESVKKALNEIGDTPKGNFALNAVKGRAAARPRYHNDKYGSLKDKEKQNNIVNQADDKAWDNYQKNPKLGYHNEAGYNYGYQKGMNENMEENSSTLNEIGDTAKGQYMLGRLQGRQMNQGQMDNARNTRNYASKQMTNKFGNRTPKNFQDFDVNQSANDYGYRDERNPQLSKDIMQQNNNKSNYEANVRNNHLKGFSKFK